MPTFTWIALLAGLILLVTLFSEQAARRGWLPVEQARKLLHVVAVSATALAPLLIPQRGLIAAIAAGAGLLLFVLLAQKRLSVNHLKRRSWGIAYFPLAYALLLLAPLPTWALAQAMLILAWADAAAALAGEGAGRGRFQLSGDGKSWTGSSTFMMVAFGLLVLPYRWAAWGAWLDVPALPDSYWLAAALFIATALAAVEALASGGSDNIFVPLVAGLLLFSLGERPDDGLLGRLWQVLLIVPPLLYGSWRFGLLDAGGAVAAALLALAIVGYGGWPWLWPVGFFFLGSSLIGRLGRPAASSAADAKQQRARDYVQVAANGGWGGLCALAFGLSGGAELWAFLFVLSFAASTADTWSSEWGMLLRGRTYDVLRWRPVPQGLSGGVSLWGTLAGALGAALTVGMGWLMWPAFSPAQMLWLLGLGFFNTLLDSVLGSALQARYQQPDGQLADTPKGAGQRPALGWRWMSNDLVNALSIVLTLGLGGLVYLALGG